MLSKFSNIQYTPITLDAGAAGKFYIIWNNENKFTRLLFILVTCMGIWSFLGWQENWWVEVVMKILYAR